MRHGVTGKRLSRNKGHRTALLKNLATSIIERGLAEDMNERHVVTTVTKAKAIRGLVERLITYAKQGDLASRRNAGRIITKASVLKGLFDVLGKRYAKRPGGYTRVLKLGTPRVGDASDMAVIALVEEEIRPKTKKKAPKAKSEKKKVDITKAEAKPEGAAAAASQAEKPAAQ